MKWSKGFLVCFIICLLPLTGVGDTILLKSGDQIIGNIVSSNDQEVLIDVNGVQLKVLRGDIAEITRKESPSSATPTVVAPIPISSGTETTVSPVLPLTPTDVTPTIQAPAKIVPSVTPDDTKGAARPLLPVIIPKGKTYQVIGAGVRFRKGPSLEYELIDTLPGQTILIEIEFVDNWLHAKTLAGVEGWIHPSFVQAMENIPCLVTGNRVNVRETPDEISRSLSRLRIGDVVVRLEDRGDWWFVLSSDMVAGWCNRQYLSPLEDKNLYRPPMRIISNAEAGMPILLDRKADIPGNQQVTLVLRDENLAIAGKTRLIVFHRDPTLFISDTLKYVSEAIVQRDRLENALAILETGLPEEVASNNVGADLLTLLGERVEDGWKYSIVLPDAASISFGFVYQEGANRGALIVIQ